MLLGLRPDIAVIQEASSKDCDTFRKLGFHVEWTGSTRKGLSVICGNDWSLRSLDWRIPAAYFIPFEAIRGRKKIVGLGVWAMPTKDSHENSYVGQVYDALESLGERGGSLDLVVGDFNANSIWDNERRKKTFTAVSKKLESFGLRSIYHTEANEPFGAESQPTFHMYRRTKPSYHIDYCFASKQVIGRLKSFEIGRSRTWLEHSDHLSIIVDFQF